VIDVIDLVARRDGGAALLDERGGEFIAGIGCLMNQSPGKPPETSRRSQ